MSPAGMRVIQQGAIYAGVLSGGCCLVSFYMNKFANLSRLPCGIPVNTIAKVGTLGGIIAFGNVASIIFIREKFPLPSGKQVAYSFLSYCLYNSIGFSILHIARNNLQAGVRSRYLEATILFFCATSHHFAWHQHEIELRKTNQGRKEGIVKVLFG